MRRLANELSLNAELDNAGNLSSTLDGLDGLHKADEEYPDNVVLDSRQGVAVEYLVGKAG